MYKLRSISALMLSGWQQKGIWHLAGNTIRAPTIPIKITTHLFDNKTCRFIHSVSYSDFTVAQWLDLTPFLFICFCYIQIA